MSPGSGIKLKYEILKNPQFFAAFGKVYHCTAIKDVKAVANVARLGKLLDKEAELCQEVFIKVVKQYAHLDDKGEIKSPEGRPGGFEIKEENKDAWVKAMEDFNATEAELFAKKIAGHDLVGANLSPADLVMLEPILLIDLGDEEKPALEVVKN
jgi:hypothetical protein